MHWFRPTIFLLPLALFGCASSPDSAEGIVDAGQAPPASLVQENCRKADAIVLGLVSAQHAGDSASYSTATIQIEKVYKGPFHPDDTVQYTFFKGPDEPALLGKKLIFFLKPYRTTGSKLWVRASDLPVFSANAATDKLLHKTLK